MHRTSAHTHTHHTHNVRVVISECMHSERIRAGAECAAAAYNMLTQRLRAPGTKPTKSSASATATHTQPPTLHTQTCTHTCRTDTLRAPSAAAEPPQHRIKSRAY